MIHEAFELLLPEFRAGLAIVVKIDYQPWQGNNK